jgi:hypothetical protein
VNCNARGLWFGLWPRNVLVVATRIERTRTLVVIPAAGAVRSVLAIVVVDTLPPCQ